MKKPEKAKAFSTKAVKAKTHPGFHRDGATKGLYLKIAQTIDGGISKSWVYRFVSPVTGKPRWMGLGPADAIGLAKARELARAAREAQKLGSDPIITRREQRAAAKIETAKRVTFGQCARDYIAENRSSWKNPKHVVQWEATCLDRKTKKGKLIRAITAGINDLPVAEIDLALVLKVLKPMWRPKTEGGKPETASRVQGRIENVLSWATVHGLRRGDNPARWSGYLDMVLPAKNAIHTVEHFAALPYAEMPQFMSELRARDSVSARALEFTVLTAARTGAAIGAKWDEIDFREKIWTVPRTRAGTKMTKKKQDHRVPLSDRTIAILKSLPREGDYIFPGGKEKKPLREAAMDQLLKGMGYGSERATVHGFRSSFRDWVAEATAFPHHVAEMALAHTIGDKVEAAYRRGDLFKKRQQLMAAWARYCASAPVRETANNVTSIRAGT